MTTHHHEHETVDHDHDHDLGHDQAQEGECCVPAGDGTTCHTEGHNAHDGHDHHEAHAIADPVAGHVASGHDAAGHDAHAHHDMGSVTRMAVSATLHCLTGCAIGEIAGLIIGTAAGVGNGVTIAISIALAFVFGFSLSSLPLLKAGLSFGAALSIVFAADTLSIATMELTDNVVMALIPGAMNAGLVNVLFWVGMMISLTVAFFAAWPVNRYLLQRGKGHALIHEYHGAAGVTTGARRFIPSFGTGALIATIAAFMLGGLVVSIADELKSDNDRSPHAAQVVHE